MKPHEPPTRLAPKAKIAPDRPAAAGAGAVAPGQVVAELEKHVLTDGFKLVIDLQRSRGSRLVDAVTGRSFLDFYSFFASLPVGFNHPWFDRPEVEADSAGGGEDQSGQLGCLFDGSGHVRPDFRAGDGSAAAGALLFY